MKTKTAEQVKREYRSKGITFASIAKEKGWRPQDIYKVLNGQIKGYRGKSHDIAVYFGLIENTQEKEMSTDKSTKQSDTDKKTYLTREEFKRYHAEAIAKALNRAIVNYNAIDDETVVKLEILDIAQTLVSTPIQLSAYKGVKQILRQGNTKLSDLVRNLKDKN
ncbi:MAG: hypothetical protein KGV56_00205 [Gammaproteobacteria bacterium]|nr:hypothetical protein [Gammaproteobacteria bacterium]